MFTDIFRVIGQRICEGTHYEYKFFYGLSPRPSNWEDDTLVEQLQLILFMIRSNEYVIPAYPMRNLELHLPHICLWTSFLIFQAEYDEMLMEYSAEILPVLAKSIGVATFLPYFAGFLPALVGKTVILWCLLTNLQMFHILFPNPEIDVHDNRTIILCRHHCGNVSKSWTWFFETICHPSHSTFSWIGKVNEIMDVFTKCNLRPVKK